jgi:hypothetical protein
MALPPFPFTIASFKFFVDIIYGPRVELASTKMSTIGIRRGEVGQGVALTNIPLPCVDYIDIRDPHLLDCSGLVKTPAGIASLL